MSRIFERGSLVWAKMPSYPWWPAMVDDDPDYGAHFSPKTNIDEVNSLHVVFLDKEVSRRWIQINNILPFDGEKYTFNSLAPFVGQRNKDYTNKVKVAYDRAMAAIELPINERLKSFGFVPRFRDSLYESSLSETDIHLLPGSEPERRKKLSKKKAKKSGESES